MQITVRRAVEADADAVGAITEGAYRVDGHLDDERAAGYAEELRAADERIRQAVVLVAESDGEIVASVTLAAFETPFAETALPGELEVRMLGVAPGARRRKVAEALMAAAMDEAQATGASRMVLCTMPSMTGAQRLYERLGYERQPERDWAADGVDLISYGKAVD